MSRRAYLFDLDGVLADGAPGLVASLEAAFGAFDVRAPSHEELRAQVGRSLPDIFDEFLESPSPADIDRAIAAFRDYFERCGIRQNHLYDGVPAMLQRVRESGAKCYVVTSKPEFYARQIVTDFGLTDVFDDVVGVDMNEGETDKAPLVARALDHAGVPGRHAVMVGDRGYDVVGALANDVRPIGALWGYGGREELELAGCRDFAATPAQFVELYV